MFEYKVVPAPEKGEKARGIKAPEARFAATLQTLMNTLGADGWEYVRADTLPSTERSGLRQATTVWRHLLIFRRPIGGAGASAAAASQPAVGSDDPSAPFPTDTPKLTRGGSGKTASSSEPDQVAAASDRAASDTAEAAHAPREDPEIVEPVRKLFAHRSDDGARPAPPLRATEDRPVTRPGTGWDDRSGS